MPLVRSFFTINLISRREISYVYERAEVINEMQLYGYEKVAGHLKNSTYVKAHDRRGDDIRRADEMDETEDDARPDDPDFDLKYPPEEKLFS
jgi:hypothetical protein